MPTVARNAEWRTELALFESAMRVCPSSLKVRSNLALMYLQRAGDGDAARAEGLLDGALALHANFSAALFNRANLRDHALKDTAQAIRDLDHAISLDPNNRRFYANRALRLRTPEP